MKFFIYAPSYNENSGGCIVLHRLVHIINEHTDHEAYLVPRKFESLSFITLRKFFGSIKRGINNTVNAINFKTNEEWNTPVIKRMNKKNKNEDFIVYSEITAGNPLHGRNIIRWFLHQPGHFTKEINYSLGELYFKFNTAIKDFILYGSKLSNVELKVIHYPIEFYNENNIKERSGDCYLIRKGKDKEIIHDSNAICIDNLSHEQVSKVFKKCKRFICYDDYTAYSIFSVLCGCESIVVPSADISLLSWYPNEEDRFGIAYGMSDEQLDWANKTKVLVLDRIRKEHEKSIENVKDFILEVDSFFHNKEV